MKKALLFLFAAAMALTSAAQTNLAVGKTSIATSGTNVAFGNDGDEGSRWESEHGVDPQSWQVDLGESTTINAVRIVWEPAYAKSFDIIVGDEVDADGYVTNGTTVLSVVDQVLPSNNNVQVFTFTAVQARYVMFHGLARATSYGYSFYEFGVYNLTDPMVLTTMKLSAADNQTIMGTPIALTLLGKDQLGATIATGDVNYVLSDPSVGSVSDGQFIPAAAGTTTIKAVAGTVESNEVTIKVNAGEKINLFSGWETRVYDLGQTVPDSKVGAFDANDGSVWDLLGGRTTGDDAASRTYDVGFIADLRGIYDITNISIHFEGACSENFTLSFAGADGVFGDAVYTGGATGINNHTETFSGQSVTNVRYVKFFSTKAATQWGVKIFDFSVCGVLKSEIEDAVAPTVSATAGEATDESVTLNITGNDNTSKYLAYEIKVGDGAAKVYALGTNVAGTAAPVTIAGLNGGTEYTFTIVAIDAFGNRSEATTVTASTVGEVFTLTSAPAPTHDADNVKSIFSDAYTPVTSFNPGWWSQATVLDYVTVGQDNIMYLTNFNYQGLEYVPDTGFSIADMDYIHIDVLPMQEMNLGITPIMKGGVTEKSTSVGTLNVKQWNSIDLPLSVFGFDLENFNTFQLKLDGGDASKILYVDNIYFWKDGGDTPPTPTELTNEGVDENGVVTLSGTWDLDQFKAIDAEALANAYDFTAVEGLPQNFNNQNMATNPNTLFIAPRADVFLFNEVVPTDNGYNGYNIQIIDHFINEADHSINTSIAPISVSSPFFQRVTRMGGVYATTVLPFNKNLPSNVQFYEITGVTLDENNNVSVDLNQVTDVQAGVPYIAHLDGADIVLAGGGETTITWETSAVDVNEFSKFVATYKTVNAPSAGVPGLRDVTPVNYTFDIGTEVDFAPAGEIPAMRSYLEVITSDTGIDGIKGDVKDIIFNIYTIDGRLIRQNVQSAEGLDKGIYIIKGKKVLVK